MISPHTLPGTHVVCNGDYHSVFLFLPPLWKGRTYVVAAIVLCPMQQMFGVELQGFEKAHRTLAFTMIGPGYPCYDPKHFDYAVLPKCLTEILERAPVTVPNPVAPVPV